MNELMVLIDEQGTILYNNQTSLLDTENLPPVSTDDSGTIFEDEIFYGNVLSNDSDPNGDPITVSAVNGFTDAVGKPLLLASGAIVTINADGSYYYDPNGQFDALNDGEIASDNLQYTVSDPGGASINAGLGHTINGKSLLPTSTQPPIAVDDNITIRKNEIGDRNILQNDSNPEGGKLSVDAVKGSEQLVDREFVSPLGANVQILRGGTYTYFPKGIFNNLLEGQTAMESFDYTIINNGGLTATAKITVTIQGFNDLPAGFDAAQYGASNPDLIPIYHNDLAGLTTHYLLHGRAENRPLDNFDEFRYVASSYAITGGDLIGAFGLNGTAATQHYLTNGFAEGRSKTAFDPARYLNSYDDLHNNLGTNTLAATQHFITNGFTEKRNPNLFLSDRYIASYGDLINSIHYDLEKGSNHYLLSGRSEGRHVTFSPEAYLSKYSDLQTAFGNDLVAATKHFIEHGYTEGRMPA